MKTTLLAVRLPPTMLADLHACPGIRDRFNILAIGQHDEAEIRFAADGKAINYLRDWPHEGAREATHALYRAIRDSCRVTHAIIAQPLHWYSNEARDGLLEGDAFFPRIFWLESYFERAFLDEVGCPYMADNEVVRYAHECISQPIRRRQRSKFDQPEALRPAELYELLGPTENAVVVYGQVPGDMALADTSGGMPYEDWIDAIVRSNPQTRFLFKHHPLMRTELAPRPNLVEIGDYDTLSLLEAYPLAAAYSSTVIVEAVMRGVKIATGGHHALAGLVPRITKAADAAHLIPQLDHWEKALDMARIADRISFLEHRYSVRLSDPDALVRLTVDRSRVLDFYRSRA
jgi:hypothetical protein